MDFKGTPIPRDNPRENFKSEPISAEPPGPNPEKPTRPNIERVPWANFKIEEAVIPGAKARIKGKQRERHYEYTRTRHQLSSSRERCVGICLPMISDDRARIRRVRRRRQIDDRRRQIHNGGNARIGHCRWLSQSRRRQ